MSNRLHDSVPNSLGQSTGMECFSDKIWLINGIYRRGCEKGTLTDHFWSSLGHGSSTRKLQSQSPFAVKQNQRTKIMKVPIVERKLSIVLMLDRVVVICTRFGISGGPRTRGSRKLDHC